MSQQLPPNVTIHGSMVPGNPNQMIQMQPNPNQVGPMGPANVQPPNIVPVVNQNQPQMAPAPQQHSQPTGSSQPQHDTIIRLRSLEVIEAACVNLTYNSNIDNGTPNPKMDETIPRYDRALEDFYGICNQIELILRTIIECHTQTRDSQNYLPFNVIKEQMSVGSEIPENSLAYNHYLNLIKKQVSYAKSVYEILSESVKQIKAPEAPIIPQPQQMNPIQQQQQQQQGQMPQTQPNMC
ncbi:hypothetical protein RDWZM_009008 [Blomia tropicalis]|uniref:Mediator of RNA polymerase II transcription subunit 29 n=1 Tax=Blomia tropicalis TaxID=40697 RepID=A0A9Q0RKM9_BLOTA|nr:hypothetical protein RDWZM_009008 [Blomia tropicalis]